MHVQFHFYYYFNTIIYIYNYSDPSLVLLGNYEEDTMYFLLKYLTSYINIIYFVIITASACIRDKRFWCPNKCGKNYKHKKNMRSHYLHECGIPAHFLCIICTKNFKRNEHLKKHLLLVHKIEF